MKRETQEFPGHKAYPMFSVARRNSLRIKDRIFD